MNDLDNVLRMFRFHMNLTFISRWVQDCHPCVQQTGNKFPFIMLFMIVVRCIICDANQSYWSLVYVVCMACWANDELIGAWNDTIGRRRTRQPCWCWNRNIPCELGQYHGCWCPGSFRYQGINSHSIYYVRKQVFVTYEEGYQILVPSIFRND